MPCAACGVLVPQPGIEPMPPTVEAQSLNHWLSGKSQQGNISNPTSQLLTI